MSLLRRYAGLLVLLLGFATSILAYAWVILSCPRCGGELKMMLAITALLFLVGAVVQNYYC